jgi:predicted Fe-Mo cluster-binding NifX family protein
MRVVVSSQGQDLDAPASSVFGRCPTLVFVDTDSMEFEALPNPAASAGGGAGIQAAQFVVNQGAGAVLTGNLGPNAFDVLDAAGVSGYLVPEGTVRQAIQAFLEDRLQPMAGASAVAHAGMGAGGRGVRGQSTATASARESKLSQLRQELKTLRQQLAETMEEIEKLEEED